MWNFRALVLQFLGSGRNPCSALVHHHRNGLTSIPSSLTTIASTSSRFSTPNHHFLQQRLFVSPPDKLLVKAIVTKDDHDLELKRIQDQSLPAIFCFTTYAEPLCFYVAKNIREINQQFPHVAISEIVLDAQADNYKSTLKDFGISYTPSFHFFKNGEKVNKSGLKKTRTDAEAYARHLKRIVGQLYRIQPTMSSSNKRTTQKSGVETLKKGEQDRSSVELILSKEEYNLAINRIEATIAASHFLQYDLSELHVAIYEFILDPKEDDYETTLNSLNITSTPTFHFFKNGKKVDELACGGVGFYHYTTDLGKILENLYNPNKLGKQAKKKVIGWRRCLS